jgi:hypothetical protein
VKYVCFNNKRIELIQNLNEGKLDIKTLQKDIKNFYKEGNPFWGKRIIFNEIIQTTLKKLKNELSNINENEENILNSIKLVFKPGLFISAIIGGISLDLRNF